MSGHKKIKYLKAFSKYFLVFVLFFIVFHYIQFSFLNLGGADAYYHIKHSYLIRTKGLDFSVESFPWMQLTIFKDFPGDPWFGYHLFLTPFTFGNLIFGAKLGAVVFASLFFTSLFWVLKQFQVKHAWFWTILLFLIGKFDYRLLLSRPYILSVSFAVLAVYFISKKRYLWLLLLSAVWAFTSIEAPLIIALALLWVGIEWFKDREIDWGLVIIPPLGCLVAFVIRPDFPHNLSLLFYSTFKVMLLRLEGVDLVFGNELLISFRGLVKDNIFLFLSSFLPISYLLIQGLNKKWRETPKWYWYFFVLSWGFAGLSLLKSQRFVEYWAPFAVIFAGLSFNNFLLPQIPKLKESLIHYRNYNPPFKSKFLLSAYHKFYQIFRKGILLTKKQSVKICLISIVLSLVFYFGVAQIFMFYPSSMPTRYRAAALWLKENSSPGAIVLNEPWSTFPFLFFYNHQNYYGWGMDPSFMYSQNKALYWQWRNLVEKGIICSKQDCEEENRNPQEIYQLVRQEFGVDYILLDRFHSCSSLIVKDEYQEFEKSIADNDKIKKVFDQGDIEIYRVDSLQN